jgi:N-acetyl-gamma-glutamyl-phosphate reductase/acetylglutamate kinase
MFLSFLVSAVECSSQATLLYSIGTEREVERYLSPSSHPSQSAKSAVIKISGAALDQIDELAFSLSFLNCVGLYPVVLHGAGPQQSKPRA